MEGVVGEKDPEGGGEAVEEGDAEGDIPRAPARVSQRQREVLNLNGLVTHMRKSLKKTNIP